MTSGNYRGYIFVYRSKTSIKEYNNCIIPWQVFNGFMFFVCSTLRGKNIGYYIKRPNDNQDTQVTMIDLDDDYFYDAVI